MRVAFFLLLAFTGNTFAQTTQDQKLTGADFQILKDATGQLQITDMLKPEISVRFKNIARQRRSLVSRALSLMVKRKTTKLWKERAQISPL